MKNAADDRVEKRIKIIAVMAIWVPYMVASVFFLMKMAGVCGTGSLALTGFIWIFASLFIFFIAKDLMTEIGFVNDGDRAECLTMTCALWVVVGVIEIFFQKALIGEACGVLSAVPLFAWLAGAVLGSLASQAIPNMFKNY